ncbi:MAG: transcription antitermination factor NusB [Firmicutes bacterium]|nr:transcription antitermination factor NusB [Bacillota bacterium]
MRRTESREAALALLFERFARRDEDAEKLYSTSVILREQKTSEYMRELYFGVCDKCDFLDWKIEGASRGWSMERMSAMTAAILRLSAYELYFENDMPARVIINEAVELAKTYDAVSSPSFVNGVLGKLASDAEAYKSEVEPV